MSFNLAIILRGTAQASPGKPVAVYAGGLPKNTIGKVLKGELVPR